MAEGLTTREMINLLNAEPMLSGEVTLAVKEGELLPETYTYVRGDTRNSIVMQAAKAMQKVKREAWEKRAGSAVEKCRRDDGFGFNN